MNKYVTPLYAIINIGLKDVHLWTLGTPWVFLYVNLSLKNALIVMSIYLRTLDFISNVMYFRSDKSLKLR